MAKITLSVPTDYEIKTFRAVMNVRYWEDGFLNGKEDSEGKMPLRNGDMWIIDIDVDTGKIVNWPEGNTAMIHYKVCDGGVYSIIDTDGDFIMSIDGYVPSMMCPKNSGYGDYVIMDIDKEGYIDGWEFHPDDFNDEDN